MVMAELRRLALETRMLQDLIDIYMQRESKDLKGSQSADHMIILAKGTLLSNAGHRPVDTIVLCFV